MTLGAVLSAAVALAVALWVLAPLWRGEDARAMRSPTLSEEEDLRSRHEMALVALRDLEDDRATGKIGDDDYEESKARLTATAIDIMKRMDALASRSATTSAGETVVAHVPRPRAR